MPSILNLADQLLTLAKQSFERMEVARARTYLERLIHIPGISPARLAEANFFLAQCHYQQSEFAKAEQTAARAVTLQPDHADSRYLLARSACLQDKPKHRHMLEHLAKTGATVIENPRQASALGRALTRAGRKVQGLKLLESAYASEPSDPVVVEDFVEGLLAAKRLDDAELVAKQADYRHRTDARFRSLHHRLRQRLVQERLAGTRQESKTTRDPHIVPFRNFSEPKQTPSSRGEVAGIGTSGSDLDKPTAPERRSVAARSKRNRLEPTGVPGVLRLDGRMDLGSLLGKSGPHTTQAVYWALGLAGEATTADQRRAIQLAMRDPEVLAAVVRELPAASRKLLKTLVRAGGLVPATVLFQFSGPDAPPPDYAQALVDRGLLFFGQTGPAGSDAVGDMMSMAAVVPTNLLKRLASLLKVRVGE